MWTRKQLKENAKAVLSKYYWTAFAVCIIISLLVGGTNGFSSLNTYSNFASGANTSAEELNRAGVVLDELDHLDPEIVATIFLLFGFIVLLSAVVWLFATAMRIFLFNPLIAGKTAYFIRQREDCGKIGNLGIAFKKGKYKGTILTMFLKELYLWLWSLLFVIPGIIKSYSYFMVPYIVADNPELPASRIFEISKKTMKGEKWNLFVLQLSFILWDLACCCTCGLGFFFHAPYKETTYAELYACLKNKAIHEGIINEGELPRSIWNDSSASAGADF